MNRAMAVTLGRVYIYIYIYIYQTFIQMFGTRQRKLSTT